MAAVILVGAFQPGGQIDVVPHDRIVESLVAAEIADAHEAGIDTDADIDGRQFSEHIIQLHLFESIHHAHRCPNGMHRMAPVFERCAPDRHDGIPDEFIHRTAMSDDAVAHGGQILVHK